MEVSARLRFARVSPQKARLVVDLIRGKDVNEALKVLSFTPKKTALMLKKLVQSAVKNARQNQAIDIDHLFVKSISVDQGPVLKRFMPRAQGRASEIRKRMSHINLVLEER